MKNFKTKSITSYLSKIDNLSQSEKSAKTYLWACIIIFFILIFILNKLYPLFADDWSYSFVYTENERVKSIKDIFISQYRHYFMWGGRTIVHLIAQFLLFLPSWLSDIINSTAYIVFTFVIYKIVRIGETKESPLTYLLIHLLLWYLLPSFGEDFLWITGSSNYLWGTLFILLFLYPYCKLIFDENKTEEKNVSKAILFCMYGGIAGWTNENTVLAMIIGSICILVWLKISKKNIPYWVIGGILGALLGYSLMIAAPGNYIRYKLILSVGWNRESDSTFGDHLFRLTHLFYNRIFPIISIFIFILIIKLKDGNSSKQKQQIYTSALFLFFGLVSFGIMIFSPTFPDRAWMGIIVFFIIALLRIIDIKDYRIKRGKLIITTCLLSYYIVTYTQAAIELNQVSTIFNDREELIKSKKDKKDFELIVNKKIPPLKIFKEIVEIPSDRDNWLNRDYCRFQDIKSFKTEDLN